MDIADRLDIIAKQECFTTPKDHKEDYKTNPKYRLLNPTKSQLGKIRKQVLGKINKTLRSELNINQWQNSKLLTGLKTFSKRVYILLQSLTFKNFIHQSLKSC